MIRRLVPLVAFLVASSPGAPVALAQEAEEILDYDVTIDVDEGGIMHVKEVIRVRALGDQIRRGIYRDIPTSFPGFLRLSRIEAPFEVVSVTRNSQPERYAVETVGGPIGRRGMRIRIGDPGVLLGEGVHEYAIDYVTSRWVRFGDGIDELYWNVTGNDWAFPIRSATARVTIEGVDEPIELEAWTGYDGSTETDATLEWNGSTSTAVFETTDPLSPGEGLTVGISFPSGQLAPPTAAQRGEWTRLDWGGWIDAGYVVLFVIAVYLLMWRRVGMDPAPIRVGIMGEPPAGYSPAALGFIEDRGYDQTQLSAALVSMALKGAIKIDEEIDGWRLDKVNEPDELEEPLSAEEAVLFQELLGSRSSISLSRSNHTTLRSAIKSFRSSLASRLEREYFENNRRWFAFGLAVSLLGFGILAWRWRFDINPVALFLGFWLTGWSAGVGTMAYRLFQEFRAARKDGGAGRWASVGFLALFSVPFFVAEIVVTGILFVMVPVHLVIAGVVIGLTNVLFYHLLERPTLKGRGVLDGLDAFRAHLASMADRASRLASGSSDPRSPAEMSLGTFERFLPFAIALNLEDQWASAFAAAMPSALQPGGGPPYFDWYRPRGEDLTPTRLVSDLGSGLGSRISAMSSPPSSSGGGGGGFSSSGGSSGGGGGGGGGGGW